MKLSRQEKYIAYTLMAMVLIFHVRLPHILGEPALWGIFYGGPQYILWVLYQFLRKRDINWGVEKIWRIPVSFTGFFFITTFICLAIHNNVSILNGTIWPFSIFLTILSFVFSSLYVAIGWIIILILRKLKITKPDII